MSFELTLRCGPVATGRSVLVAVLPSLFCGVRGLRVDPNPNFDGSSDLSIRISSFLTESFGRVVEKKESFLPLLKL